MVDENRIEDMCEPLTTILGFECRPSKFPCSRFAVLALAVGLSACALATSAPPTVEVLSVRLTGIGPTEQQLETTLCVTNPNSNEIGFQRVTVNLDVSGLPLASGTSNLPVRLRPASSTVVPFTVLATVRNVGLQLLGILQSGRLAYRIYGTVALDSTLGLTLPFARSGQLDLLDGRALASNTADAMSGKCVAGVALIPPRP